MGNTDWNLKKYKSSGPSDQILEYEKKIYKFNIISMINIFFSKIKKYIYFRKIVQIYIYILIFSLVNINFVKLLNKEIRIFFSKENEKEIVNYHFFFKFI